MTRAVLAHTLARSAGAIVNITSDARLRGSAAGTASAVSKHGLIDLTRSTSVTYRDREIRVNAVAPGEVATSLDVNVNVGRVARAEELAAAIPFLAADAASNVRGAVGPVDNGWSATEHRRRRVSVT